MLFCKKCFITLLLLCLFLAIFYFAERKVYKANDGFSPNAIQFTLDHNPSWEIPPLNDLEKSKLEAVLSQSYTYLGKGARSYAFLSEDKQNVLKFFKYRYHVPHWTVRWFPSIPPFEYFRQKKIHKVSLDTVLNGYQIAYEIDKEGSGLLYLHLNETTGLHPTLYLTDKQGKPYQIDLDATRFIVQKRVWEAEEIIDSLFREGEIFLAKKRLRALFSLYRSHYQKGVTDLGVGILHNNGFDEKGKPIHFDVGKMVKDEMIRDPEVQFARLNLLAERVIEWIKKRYPVYEEEIRKDLKILLRKWYLS